VLEGSDPPYSALPPDVAEIVVRAAAARIDARYASAAHVAIACEAALSARELADPPRALADRIAEIDPTAEQSIRHGARDLVDLELVLEREPGGSELADTSLITRPVPPPVPPQAPSAAPRRGVIALLLMSMLLASAAGAVRLLPPAAAPPRERAPETPIAPAVIPREVDAPPVERPVPPKDVVRSAKRRVSEPAKEAEEPIGFEIDIAQVRERLDQISRRLESERERIGPTDFEAFELRYFELRSAARTDVSPERCSELMNAADELDGAVGRAIAP
jgi:hypothetical protein